MQSIGPKRSQFNQGAHLLLRYFLCLWVAFCVSASAKNSEQAQASITGYGLIGNRQLKKTVTLLRKKGEKPETFDANFVEDAALLLISRMNNDGYQSATVTAQMTLADGTRQTKSWTKRIEDPLPRPLAVKRVKFQVHRGVLYHFEKIDIEGLTVLREEDARHFFVETDALIPLKRTRTYSPQRLRGGLSNLREALERKGFENAEVKTNLVSINPKTGSVDVKIAVVEGKKSVIRSVRREIFHAGSEEAGEVTVIYPGADFSKLWLQDFTQGLKTTFYRLGYPDTTVEHTQLRREEQPDRIEIDQLTRVRTGRKITIADIRFEGEKHTKEAVLQRRVLLHPEEPFDLVKIEQGRYRLARLGIFNTVELDYDQIDEETREILYRVREGKRIEFSLLFGYGSYELLRGGIDVEQYNVFGRAHHAHLRLIQSFKSSSADYTYTMPEFVGRDIDVFLNADGLRRQEITFLREEYGGGAGLRRYLKRFATDMSLRYNYQVLNSIQKDVNTVVGVPSANVGSIVADLKHDQRDNPLYPRRGYKVFSTLEIASAYLGGDVDFQRFEANASYHHPIGKTRWINLGLTHGFVTTIQGSSQDLPFNKRFFPGGENSVRGYQQGQAAPRDANGQIIGAETYVTANIEVEQGLTRNLSVVTFLDSIGFAEHIRDYPFRTGLFSIGGGFRWKTLIGPARLEYGYNLNPRTGDPVGTLHFSIGFPF